MSTHQLTDDCSVNYFSAILIFKIEFVNIFIILGIRLLLSAVSLVRPVRIAIVLL